MKKSPKEPISVTLPFIARLPANAMVRLQEWARIETPLGRLVTLDDLMEGESWNMVMRICQQESLQNRVLSPIFANGNWPDLNKPDPDWIALIIAPGNLQPAPLNPHGDFDLALPAPCKGSLREGIPIIVRDNPEGNLEGAFLENTTISRRLFEALGGESGLTTTGPVIHKGKTLTDWFRFRPQTTCAVISSDTYGPPVKCVQCNSSFVGSIGVWLAAKSPKGLPSSIAQDETGFHHARVAHPMAISIEMAQRIEERFRGHGYHLSPVFSYESSTAQRVREILQDLNALRNTG
jgi:hypothetical protein